MSCCKVGPSPSTVSLNPTIIPTFVRGALPARDETVAEVEGELMGHTERNADGLDMVTVVEGRAEQHQCHVIIRCDAVVVLMHSDFADGADLGVSSWSR